MEKTRIRSKFRVKMLIINNRGEEFLKRILNLAKIIIAVVHKVKRIRGRLRESNIIEFENSI